MNGPEDWPAACLAQMLLAFVCGVIVANVLVLLWRAFWGNG